jgi:hypothetical protein
MASILKYMDREMFISLQTLQLFAREQRMLLKHNNRCSNRLLVRPAGVGTIFMYAGLVR